jgi:alcohol dehydrogenase, propanol-preferring
MRALQLVAPGRIEVRDVPVPSPGPTEVLVKVAGAGLCHSDVHVLHIPQPVFPPGMTLGHETAGYVAATGSQVAGLAEGDAVLVYLVWACGKCTPCIEGRDNVCTAAGRLKSPPCPGLGPDGGMAEYIKVDARFCEPLGSLDPQTAAPLADAGLTPMHAINGARHRLTPGATALIIGVGGLGHMGLQILRQTSGTRIIALDTSAEKLDWARANGADDTVLASESAAEEILGLAGGYGVNALFDFVGIQPTVELAGKVIAPDGALRVVGVGGGTLPFGSYELPWGIDLRRSYGGNRADQRQVLDLARLGKITVLAQTYPLDEGPQAFEDLEAGKVMGRAILVPLQGVPARRDPSSRHLAQDALSKLTSLVSTVPAVFPGAVW